MVIENVNSFTEPPPVLNGNKSFDGNETVNGTVTATSFVGSEAGLTGIVASSASTAVTATNTLSLGGILASNYARHQQISKHGDTSGSYVRGGKIG